MLHHKKHFLSLFLILIKPFIGFGNSSGNSIYTPVNNALQI